MRVVRSLLLVIFTYVGVASATTILSTGAPNGTLAGYGYPNTATFGETFVAPSESLLNQFTFTVGSVWDGGTPDVMAAYLGTWTGTALGSLLYQNSPFTLYGGGTIVTDAGGLKLLPGQAYVAFLSISEFYGQGNYQYIFPTTNDPGNTNGYNVWQNNGSDFSSLYNSNWLGAPPYSLEFTATFTSETPEPTSLALLGSGVFAAILGRRGFLIVL